MVGDREAQLGPESADGRPLRFAPDEDRAGDIGNVRFYYVTAESYQAASGPIATGPLCAFRSVVRRIPRGPQKRTLPISFTGIGCWY